MQNLHNLGVSEKRFDFSGKKTRLQLRRVVSGCVGYLGLCRASLKLSQCLLNLRP